MKKLLAGLVATFMMFGLVAGLSGAPAFAKGYNQHTIPTSVHIKVADRVKKGHAARIGVSVHSGGNGQPQNGHVTIRVTRTGGGYRYIDVKSYDGGTVYFTTSHLTKVGKYRVVAKFDAAANSKFMDGNNVEIFKVVR